jgi:hypothetical protein
MSIHGHIIRRNSLSSSLSLVSNSGVRQRGAGSSHRSRRLRRLVKGNRQPCKSRPNRGECALVERSGAAMNAIWGMWAGDDRWIAR